MQRAEFAHVLEHPYCSALNRYILKQMSSSFQHKNDDFLGLQNAFAKSVVNVRYSGESDAFAKSVVNVRYSIESTFLELGQKRLIPPLRQKQLL